MTSGKDEFRMGVREDISLRTESVSRVFAFLFSILNLMFISKNSLFD